jgi:HEPN domain-containing protein
LLKRKDLQKLAALRLKEARILLEHRCWAGAYYLAGYAVECALKAYLAKRTERHEFPDREQVQKQHTHNLDALFAIAELDEERDTLTDVDPKFDDNWEAVRLWNERSRYKLPTEEAARALVQAVGDRQHGLLQWLKRRW